MAALASNSPTHPRVALIVLCFACVCIPLRGLFAENTGQWEIGEFFQMETTASKKDPIFQKEPETSTLIPIPPRPASRIFDDARLFSPEERTALAAALRDTHAQDGLDVYIVATTFILGETLEDRAHRIADAWIESPKGFVLLYIRGEKTMTMSTPGSGEPFLSARTLRALYGEAIRGAAEEMEAPARIQATFDNLIIGLRGALAERERMDRVFNPDVLRLLGFFLVALSFLGGAAWGLTHFLRRLDQHQDTRYIFPPVSVPLRFGAPFGGGVCGEMQFAFRREA